jgi:cyclohexanone monooxygenase
LRKLINFNTNIQSAHYDNKKNAWTITDANGISTTCRYFLPATGPLSVAKEPPFLGLKSYTGEWYQTSRWPSDKVDFRGKRIAIVGTGATAVQIIPSLAPAAKELTVFQRTPNYILPARNYVIQEHEAGEIRHNFDTSWDHAKKQAFGLTMNATGKTIDNVTGEDEVRQILDAGWECGGFHFFFETLDDLFTNKKSNDVASEYIRHKIRTIVKDQSTADLLCPKYPFLSKRPPCGHFYYEAFNRPNVKLVDISQDEIELYEKGVRTSSGVEHEFDMIIFALGFDAATGALTEMDVRGSQNQSLGEVWANRLETYAGVLVPNFPNMFLICGPHVPFGNMPVVLDIGVHWIGKTIQYMEENKLAAINVTGRAVEAWASHLDDAFRATLMADYAETSRAWFVGANIPGKPKNVLFYFGGVPGWAAWLENECTSSWASMDFSPPASRL